MIPGLLLALASAVATNVAFLLKYRGAVLAPPIVVFPAIQSGVDEAVKKHEKDGVDVSAFTSYLKTKKTLLYPITDKAPQINLIVQPTMEDVLLGKESAADALPKMNDQVNNQLKYASEQ